MRLKFYICAFCTINAFGVLAAQPAVAPTAEEVDALRRENEALRTARERDLREFERSAEQARLQNLIEEQSNAAWRVEQVRRDWWSARFDALRWNAFAPGYGFLKYGADRGYIYGGAFWSSLSLGLYWQLEATRRQRALQRADAWNFAERPNAEARYRSAQFQTYQSYLLALAVYAVGLVDSGLIFEPPAPIFPETAPGPLPDSQSQGRSTEPVRLAFTVQF